MDPRLLSYYERELRYVREMGAEFAAEYPKVAGRLGLSTSTPNECADPYVERLLEAFAFLAARVQLKIDAEFPRFTQHLLEMVYPHYLAPVPSMAVVQLQPNLKEGALAAGFQVPRGTPLRGRLGRGQQTPCEYRTAHDVVQWPIELAEVEYTTLLTGLRQLHIPAAQSARSMLRIRLRASAALTFDKLTLDALPIWLGGSDDVSMRLYEQLANPVAIVAQPTGKPPAWREVIDRDDCVSPLGFEPEQALLPYTGRSFQGYRLLQEYFAFPSRFMFVELRGLQPALRRCDDAEIELLVLLGGQDPSLEGVVDAGRLHLFCTPAINLFPREADRIHLTEDQHEYLVVPDRTRPLDLEVHTVSKVVGHGVRSEGGREFAPLYAARESNDLEPHAAFYTVTRKPRMLSTRQRRRGTRSTYIGSEVFLSLVDGDEAAYAPDLRQLAVTTLCTNRDLPLHMAVGHGPTDFTIQTGAPCESVRCLAGPTAPRASLAHGDTTWRLVSHLSLNYLSLTDAEVGGEPGLRELLMLYADMGESAMRKQIAGLRGVKSRGIVRPLPMPGPLCFARGIEVSVEFDEEAFDGTGVFLLGAVLERFFAKYVSINSFSETVLRTMQRGEIMRWPATVGQRPVL